MPAGGAAVVVASAGGAGGAAGGAVAPHLNPVSQLNEACLKRGLPNPVFNVCSQTGPPHQQAFRMTVSQDGRGRLLTRDML